MVGQYVDREPGDSLDPPSLPSPVAANKLPNLPGFERRHMEDYLYYATPPVAVLPYVFKQYDNKPKKVIRGGFEQIETELPALPRNPFRSFPPLSNSQYELDTHCRLPRLHPYIYPEFRQPETFALQDPSSSKTHLRKSDTGSDDTPRNGSDGVQMSIRESHGLGLKGIKDDDHYHTSGRNDSINVGVTEIPSPGSVGLSGSPPSDLLDFVNKDAKSPLLPYTKVTNSLPTSHHDLDRDPRADHYNYGDDEYAPNYFTENYHSGNGSGQPTFCIVCNKDHVPISGPTKDGIWCLPDWFPKTRHVDPWDAFREVMAYLVMMEESIENGYHQRKIDAQGWNLHFHDASKSWTTTHSQFHGGWWKCRDDRDAPEAERRCKHCHRFRREEGTPSHYSRQHPPPVDVQKEFLEIYIGHHTKMQGALDKKAALAMLRRDGIPQIYSKPITYEEQQESMQPRNKLETSATERQIGDRLLKILEDPKPDKPDAGEASTFKFPLNPADYPL